MNRYEKIDSLLNYWVDISKENSNMNFGTSENYSAIYYSLIKLGVENNAHNLEYDRNFNNFSNDVGNPIFSSFLDYYKYNPNLDVYCQSDWRYFCQFCRLGLDQL